ARRGGGGDRRPAAPWGGPGRAWGWPVSPWSGPAPLAGVAGPGGRGGSRDWRDHRVAGHLRPDSAPRRDRAGAPARGAAPVQPADPQTGGPLGARRGIAPSG